MNYNFFKLKNGLRVVLVDTKTFPTLTAMLLVGAGSRFETKNNNGIAHFFEHMAFKGSKKYPNAMSLSSLVEGIGGIFNAFTSKDHTGYWIKGQAAHFETIVDVLADMIQHPLLKEDEIEREKGVIIEEINMYEDQPQYKVWELFEELIYPSHPLGYPIAGKKEIVSQFNRQTFLDYINRLYYPENLILVVAGGLGQAKNYLKIIEEKFGCWQKTGENQFLKFKEDQKKPRKLIFKKKTEQAHLVLGYPGLNYTDSERLTQSVLMTILGGGMSSRLFYELRERRGLCYYVSSGTEPFVDTGYVYTRAGLTLNAGKIQEAIKIIIDEHQKLAEKQVDEKELSKAKEMVKGHLILALEDSHNLASFFGKKLMFENKLIAPDEVLKKIDKITSMQIKSLAKKLFVDEKINLAVIGEIDEEKINLF